MAENRKSIFIRFNMEDTAGRELCLKLTKGAGNAASLTSYVKRVLEEFFNLNAKIADRQEFHTRMLSVLREEMQLRGMKLVGALLTGIGTVNVPKLPKPQTFGFVGIVFMPKYRKRRVAAGKIALGGALYNSETFLRYSLYYLKRKLIQDG